VNQIQKNASMIASVVESMATAVLVPLDKKPLDDFALDLQEFLETMEKQNALTIEDLVRKYKTIGPLLGKIEGIIEHKNTLRSPRMKSYYLFWERRIFNALNRVIH
jgi:dynein heavy chain